MSYLQDQKWIDDNLKTIFTKFNELSSNVDKHIHKQNLEKLNEKPTKRHSFFSLCMNSPESGQILKSADKLQQRFNIFLLNRTYYQLTTSSEKEHSILPILLHYFDQFMRSYLQKAGKMQGFVEFINQIYSHVDRIQKEIKQNDESQIGNLLIWDLNQIIEFNNVLEIIFKKNQMQFGFLMKTETINYFWILLVEIVLKMLEQIKPTKDQNISELFLQKYNIPIQIHYSDEELSYPDKNKEYLLLYNSSKTFNTKYNQIKSEFMIIRSIRNQNQVKWHPSDRKTKSNQYNYNYKTDIFIYDDNYCSLVTRVPSLPQILLKKLKQNDDIQIMKFDNVLEAIIVSYLKILFKNKEKLELIQNVYLQKKAECEEFVEKNNFTREQYSHEGFILKIPINGNIFRYLKNIFLFYIETLSSRTIAMFSIKFLESDFQLLLKQINTNPTKDVIIQFDKFITNKIPILENSFQIITETDYELDTSKRNLLYFERKGQTFHFESTIILQADFPSDIVSEKYIFFGLPRNSIFQSEQQVRLQMLVDYFHFNYQLRDVKMTFHDDHKMKENSFDQYIEFSSLSKAMFFTFVNLFFKNEKWCNTFQEPNQYQKQELSLISQITYLKEDTIKDLIQKFKENINILLQSKEGNNSKLLIVLFFYVLIYFYDTTIQNLNSIRDFDSRFSLLNQIQKINGVPGIKAIKGNGSYPNQEETSDIFAIIRIVEQPKEPIQYIVFFKKQTISERNNISRGFFLNYNTEDLTLNIPQDIQRNSIVFETKQPQHNNILISNKNRCNVCKLIEVEVFFEQFEMCSCCFEEKLFS